MKKALIIAAASIAASLFAVSCVENIESASVAEIRQSKTEQLEALAEAYRIKAATDSLSAAAQAELYRAQAEHQRAMALLQQANADAEGLAAEKIRLQMEQEAQKFALEIEMLRLSYNKKILDLQNQIDAAYATMLDNANNRIVALFGSYREALEDLNTYKINLNNYQTYLVAAENNVIDVQEAARGMVLALQKGRNGENYLITGRNYSYRELFSDAAKAIGRHPLLIPVPDFLLKAAGALGDLLHKAGISTELSTSNVTMLMINNHYRTDKAERELGFKAAPIDFKEMLSY